MLSLVLRSSFVAAILYVFSCYTALSQILTISPRFPKTTDSLEIIYDATKGNAGLKDSANIYIHSGVVTGGPNSTGWSNVPMTWGTADPRWKMTNLGNNKFRIRIRPTTFYNISPSLTVHRLGFVFRNASGSVTGKTSANGDIFTPIYQNGQQAISFLGLENRFILANVNDAIPYTGAASFSGGLKVFINGTEVNSVTNDTVISGTVPTNTGGTRKVVLRSTTNAALVDSFTVRVNQPLVVEALPSGMEDGINILSPTSALLVLRAPFKSNVYLIGEFNNWDLTDESQMKRSPDGKFWWLQLNNLDPTKQYSYQYLVDGSLRISDPYSELILDPNNDAAISTINFPNRKPYPTGKTTGMVSVLATQPTQYNWINTQFKRPDKKDLVVYELLIRDFGNAKTFKNLADTLGYLKKLGINCIQLMPIMEFEGNLSWGYNPSHHYALDKFYGPATAFKEFVDKAHGMCMAVVLDIALNHAFGQSPMVQLYWNAAQNRPAANSPWFNEVPKHDFNVGYDYNHQSADTRYYVDRVMKHWLDEFRIDGFRWDLSKGFTQVNTLGNTGAWGNYDASRVAIWKGLYDDMQSYSPCSYCILEHFAANNEETELANYGMMFWGNLNHNYTEAVMGWPNTSDLGWGYFRNRGWQKPHLITYMESHDEERMMYKSLMYGNVTQLANGYSLRDTTTILDRIKLASTFFYTVPGPKMIWQFGELGYGFSINFPCANPCTDGANRTAAKPIRWDYANEARRKALFNVTRSLIALKRFEPVFQTEPASSAFTIGSIAMKRIVLTHSSRNAVVLGNFGVTTANITPNFPSTGKWYEFFTGDSITVNGTTDPISLSRGEYRIYSNVRWKTPAEYADMLLTNNCQLQPGFDQCGVAVGVQDFFTESKAETRAYPNPSQGTVTIATPYLTEGKTQVQVLDVQGRLVWSTETAMYGGEVQLELNKGIQKPGLYSIRLLVDGKSYFARLLYQP
jgi:glycosidase